MKDERGTPAEGCDREGEDNDFNIKMLKYAHWNIYRVYMFKLLNL